MRKTSGLACRRGESGQGLTEYLIILALIVIAAIGVYSFFGQSAEHQPPSAVAKNPPGKAGAKDAAGAPAPVRPADLPAQFPAPTTPQATPGAPAAPETPPAQSAVNRDTGDSKTK